MRGIEGGKAICILGFRDVKIGDVDGFLRRVRACIHPVAVQMLDATRVAGESHLFFAFLNALRSFKEGRAISENLEMEILLNASGTRQISRAIEMLGLKSQTSSIATVIFASSVKEVEEAERKLMRLLSGLRDDGVLEVSGKGKVVNLMETFGVMELELNTMTGSGMTGDEALTWLIVERVSLLSVKRQSFSSDNEMLDLRFVLATLTFSEEKHVAILTGKIST